jgi:hypothetical protein
LRSAPAVRQFTDARRTRPVWLRPVNGLGRLLPGVGRPDAEAWLAKAARHAAERGAPDVEPDRHVVEALEVLTGALRTQARLNLVGRFSAQQDTVRLLSNHLRIKAHLTADPSIAETALPAPVFVIGIPRSGTTFIHHLLSHDPANRVIPYWESFAPLPPSEGPDPDGSIRAAKVDTMLAQLRMMMPEYQAIHPMSGTSPEECVALFMNLVRTLQMDIQYRVPDYTAWLVEQDAAVAYAGYADQLRLIQHLRPAGTRFVLKDPAHTWHLETVLETFPDARVVFLHRDPVGTMSSLCSLYAHTRAIFSDAVDPMAIGPEVLGGHWPDALERMMTVRDRLPEGAYVDVRQSELARDPLDVVAGVYDRLGLDLTAAARSQMAAFVEGGLPEFRRSHEHSLAGFGLSAGRVEERFAAYRSELGF